MKMPVLLLYILSFSSVLLTGCEYFKNREIKAAGTDLIMEQIGGTLDQEQSTVIHGLNTRGKDFTKYVQNHTEIKVLNLTEVTANDYFLETKIHTISPIIRQMILEMLAKMDSRTANAFNFANAMGLIHQEKPDIEIEVEQNLSIEVHNKNGKWVK